MTVKKQRYQVAYKQKKIPHLKKQQEAKQSEASNTFLNVQMCG